MRKHIVTPLFGLLATFAFANATPATAQETALPKLREAAKTAPQSLEAQTALGRALIDAGRLGEADAQMAKVVKLGGGSIEAMYEQARVKFAAGDYKAARAFCKGLLDKDAKHPLSQVCAARAALVWRRAALAREPLEKATAVAPDDYEVRLAVADERRIGRDYEAAKEAYARASAAKPGAAEPHFGRGLLHLAFGEHEAAREAFRQALTLDPDHPEIQLALGRLEHGARAVELLEAAIAGRPDAAEAKLALAGAYLGADAPAKAEPVLRAYLAKDPKDAIAHARLGVTLVRLGKLDEAQEVLDRALALRPNDYDAALALGELFERQEKHEEAIAQYRKAADLRARDPEAYLAAARLSLRLSRALLAEALIKKALERAPRSGAALALQGDVLRQRGEHKRAKDLYRQALAGEGPLDRAQVQARLREP